ncbi:unnamed protein product [Calicophoron daubneyi]|uniref:Transmembrane protein n=1 Tax=Calicophoron daubneyi TaxID=300641 RepID=A0AAV2TCW9_CALDB
MYEELNRYQPPVTMAERMYVLVSGIASGILTTGSVAGFPKKGSQEVWTFNERTCVYTAFASAGVLLVAHTLYIAALFLKPERKNTLTKVSTILTFASVPTSLCSTIYAAREKNITYLSWLLVGCGLGLLGCLWSAMGFPSVEARCTRPYPARPATN